MSEDTGRAMDGQVAERLFGWRCVGEHTGWQVAYGLPPEGQGAEQWRPVPYFSSDRNACADMEAELERRGLHWRYAASMCRLLDLPECLDEWGWSEEWVLLRATPEQRVQAALKVLETSECSA